MISWKYKSWRTASVAAAVGLAACGQGQTQPANTRTGQTNDEAGVAPAPVADAGGESGESGEGGAVSAYAGLAGDQLAALRLQHLKGFIMAADRVVDENKPLEAGILVQQGMLEVHDAAPATQFGSLNAEIVRAAADSTSLSRAERKARIRAAAAEIDRAIGALRADHAVLAARMLDVSAGLYQQAVGAGEVDPIEYQHSMGAALAARDALQSASDNLQSRDGWAYANAQRELDRYVALWPSPDAPAQPATYQQVLAQSSRVRLALSPYL